MAIVTKYPAPVASGGSHMTTFGRPMRQPGTLRQPDLGFPPAVTAVTGAGAGSGAYIRNIGSGADQSQGAVVIQVGVGAGSPITVGLSFPKGVAANQYWYAAEWAAITANPPAGQNQSLQCVPNRPLVAGERLILSYQWNVSQ